MDLIQIVQRSLSGYIFIVPGLLLYFIILKKKNRKQMKAHIIASFIFYYYLIGILTMTGIGKLQAFEPRIVMIPFLDMISGPIDTILNVILFVPFGFMLPWLWKKYSRISSVVLTGFLFSLSIEIVQTFGRGTTDINDLITNTIGTCLGYGIYKLLSKLISQKFRDFLYAVETNDYAEMGFFWIYSFIIMVTIQPFIIHTLFQIG